LDPREFMTAITRKIHHSAGLAGLALALGGCATAPPPLAELDDASAEVARARAAGAAASAPVELRFAEGKLAQAREANDDRDYRSAALLAAQATVDAELAAAKARAARARAATRERTEANAKLRGELLDEGGQP
jgi:hypothetical protein